MLPYSPIQTIDDLASIQDRVAADRERYRFTVMVCSGTPCQSSDSLTLFDLLQRKLKEHHMESTVNVIKCGCLGFCAVGPVMIVNPGDVFYQKLSVDDMDDLIRGHFMDGVPVERLMYHDPETGEVIPCLSEIPFIKLQTLRVLHNSGYINPESIEDYIWRGGYRAALKAIKDMSSRDIIDEVKESGLRGRGGGGFPSGLKWEFCANSSSEVKYVLCNADEGDPGAFMDRSVLESDPHSVIEGMIIAARAINAHHGYVYCRAEYPLALKRLRRAIDQALEYGLLGDSVFGTPFDFHLDIYKGAGAFVCGEETALMMSIEGRRGMPRPRPPFPAVSGLWGKPTILNNVETFSNIPRIILEGGETYAEIGTEQAKGTKIFSLSGKVNNFGLVEIPMGTPIGKVIFDIGGGVPGGKKFKAVQLGGPSGGCLPAEHLNLPIDYEAISKAGAIMGSGGMVVMDEDTCMVDIARFFMEFCQDESCGKCTPCRVGTRRMLEILQRICQGKGRKGDIELLENLAAAIQDTALCGLGQTAPNPVLSTIRYFRDEYEAHINDKHCPAGVCADLFASPCQHACPVEMDIPAYIALVRAGELDDAYKVLLQTNPFPSICGRVCGHPCQNKCRRAQLDEPVAIKNLKRFITDNAHRPKVKAISVTRQERVAIIGSGPSGLTAALELKKRGYAVTVYESLPSPGGMLRWGIPAYRLPRDILDIEISNILKTGIELHTNTSIGKDITFDTLSDEYDFIYLAIGAQRSMPLGIPGEEARGVYGAVEMLREYNLGHSLDRGKHVAVIGGGDSAVDAARTALREGAESVTMYYRRERKDMTAQPEEIRAAESEGVRIEYLVAPLAIEHDNGRIKSLRLAHMRLGSFDRSGRKRPEPIDGETFEVAVDMVISAIGQKADFACLGHHSKVETSGEQVLTDSGFRTSNPRVYAGGDIVTGPAMVIDAIKAGREAACAIDAVIREARGEEPWVDPEPPIEIPYEVDEDPVEMPQTGMPVLDISDRAHSFREVELGYSADAAYNEARRCLRCDGNRQTPRSEIHS